VHEIRDIKWQKEVADAELHEAFNKRSRASHRQPGHCEYMIDSYIKCRGEALRAESPEDPAGRLEEQPKYHRNYLPITRRLFAILDAQADAPPADPATEQPPLLDRPKRKKPPHERPATRNCSPGVNERESQITRPEAVLH
jgi:hypothetical protein